MRSGGKKMGMHVEKISLNEAHQKAETYTYALLFMISKRILCKTEDLPETDWEECQEARFFSEDRELHIFEGEEGMQAVEVSDADKEDIMIKEYELDRYFEELGNTLLVQEYLEYDEDGQVYVGLTRLKGIR